MEFVTAHEVQDFLTQRKKLFLNLLRTQGLDLTSADFLRYSVKDLGSSLAYDHDQPEDEVNESSLEITRTITTSAEDRYGDVVIPRGCEPTLQRYLGNPQVFFGHKSFDLPIAHTVRLEVTEQKIRATARFHEETDEARVVWRMVSKGLLPGSSIGFLPIKAAIIGSNKSEEEEIEERLRKRKAKTPDGEKIIEFDPWMALRFLQWELLEWSVVSVPANPECVEGLTKYLSDGVIEGEKIPLSISKSLQPFTLKAKIWSPGFDPMHSGYTGVLMLGQEEMEFKEGVLQRLGQTSLVMEEVPAEENPQVYEPETEQESPKKQEESSVLAEILVELKRHHTVEENHQQQEEKVFQEICSHLKMITDHLCEEDEEPKEETPKSLDSDQDQGIKKLQQKLQELLDTREKLNKKWFSLTGGKL